MNELSESFLSHFDALEDPRADNHNKRHLLSDILVITILAVICGADNWVDINEFGVAKQHWLKKFLNLPNGIPSHDTFGDLFSRIDPQQFEHCFIAWVRSLIKIKDNEVIAIDGKTVCGSKDQINNRKAIHLVNAWACKNNLVLGQFKVGCKTNEITAIPELINLLDIAGSVITVDAIGCQSDIAALIASKNADYVLSVKNNQPGMFKQIETTFNLIDKSGDQGIHQHETVCGDHGRIEARSYTAIAASCLKDYINWDNLNSVIKVESRIEFKNSSKKHNETRYYISSLLPDAKNIGEKIRAHWAVENNLHWCLDVSFNEDGCRTRKDYSAQNLSLIRKIALNIIKQEKTSKVGVKAKRNKAGWSNRFLIKILKAAHF